jgi:hypothetical protein
LWWILYFKCYKNDIVIILESGKVKWANGSTTSLTSPFGINGDFLAVKYPHGKPGAAQVMYVEDSKEKLFRDFFQYSVTKPLSTKRQCRGCGQHIASNQLCIQTQLIRILRSSCWRWLVLDNSRYVPICFCLKEACLTQGLQRYSMQVWYPIVL